MTKQLLIQAVVEETERSAILLAAGQIERGLAKAGEPVTVNCAFPVSLQDIQGAQNAGIVIASLLSEVENYDEPWSAVENRLRAQYSELTQNTSSVVFILTVFRHVAVTEPDRCEKMRIRIRRLDRLAAEISREFGTMIVDVDRDLADMGAQRLQTDYRLIGDAAQFLAGKSVALAIVSGGLDECASVEAQDAAKQIVADEKLELGIFSATDLKPSNVMSLGAGRRKQAVQTVVDSNSQSHSGWLVDRLLSGQFSVGDAFSKFRGSVARRGLRASVIMLFSAFQSSLSKRIKA